MRKTRTPRTISAKIFCPGSSINIASSPTTSATRTRRKLPTGGMWAPSTPITKQIWISFRFRRFSISTTRAGRCTPGSSNILRRNSSLPIRTASARPSIRSVRAARSFPAGAWSVRVLGYDVRVNSYSDVEDSIIFNHVNIGRQLPHPPRHHRPPCGICPKAQ